MELEFSVDGLFEGASTERQPPRTSPSLINVRPFDVEDERIRGGQRPGLTKAFTTRVGGDHPVIGMCQIAVTYIFPG